MDNKELKDFQEKERLEKERAAKAEQEKKAAQEKERKEREDREKKEREDKARHEKLSDKYEKEQAARKREEEREKKRAEKAYKPRTAEGKAREKMRKSPEHKAMREAIRDQVTEKAQTAKEGAKGPNILRDPGQQAEADKYRQMQHEQSKMARGVVGEAHFTPEMQGFNGVKDFEAQQAAAALRAQGEPKPWKSQQRSDQAGNQAKANEHGKGKDHTDPERVARDNGPDRPGPAPAPAHAHAHEPWHNKHGGHPDHASTILKDKAHAAMEGEKPWQRQHADPDRAESRMAEQAREKEREQERGSR